MGWNTVDFENQPHQDFTTENGQQFYFVHSYYVDCEEEKVIWGRTRYGDKSFCSAIQSGNLVATQFHPEKSQAVGLQIYRDFLNKIVRNRHP